MSAELLDRTPPHNRQIEQQLIGAVLLDTRILDDAASIASPDDFYVDAHRIIYGHLVGMSQENRRIDVPLLLDRMRGNGDLERVGGSAYLAEVFSSVASPRHFRDYAQVVRRDAEKRRVIRASLDAIVGAYDETTTSEDVLGTLETDLAAIKTGQHDSDPVTMAAACVAAVQEIDEIIRRGRSAGIMTGLPAFDDQIGGVFPGELTVVAARPGQGKTSLALQMAAHAAESGRVVYFASLEMGRNELALKRLCAVAGVSSMRVRTGDINAYERSRIMQAAQSVAVDNFHLHDWAAIRPFDIQRAARRVGAEIIFVDYLQIVTAPDATKKRYEQVGDISRQLKIIAREMNIPVVACCQIGRQAEQGKESRPMLSQLRESGNLEQDADVVLLLWRPKHGIVSGETSGEQPKPDRWDADFIVAKNRKGTTPTIPLNWNGDATSFFCHRRVF